MNTLVCGPPCSGKTTWVNEHAPAGALIICYDTIAADLGHRGPARPPFHLGRRAEAEVQRLITQLEHGDHDGAYLIRTMAGADRREELAARIKASVVLLNPPRAVLLERAAQRHDPRTTVRDIDRWLARERIGRHSAPTQGEAHSVTSRDW